MLRRDFLTLSATSILFSQSSILFAAEDSFADFKRQQNQGFNDYKTQLLKAFEGYKDLHDQAFNAFKKNVARNWPEIETSSPTKWVTYDESLTTKVVIDYEHKVMRLETVNAPSIKQSSKIESLLETRAKSS